MNNDKKRPHAQIETHTLSSSSEDSHDQFRHVDKIRCLSETDNTHPGTHPGTSTGTSTGTHIDEDPPSKLIASREDSHDQRRHVDKIRHLSEPDSTHPGTLPGMSTGTHIDKDPLSKLIASREADVQSAFQDRHRRPDRDMIALYLQGGFCDLSAGGSLPSMFLPVNEVKTCFEDKDFYFLDHETYVDPFSSMRLTNDVLQNGQVPDPPQFS